MEKTIERIKNLSIDELTQELKTAGIEFVSKNSIHYDFNRFCMDYSFFYDYMNISNAQIKFTSQINFSVPAVNFSMQRSDYFQMDSICNITSLDEAA